MRKMYLSLLVFMVMTIPFISPSPTKAAFLLDVCGYDGFTIGMHESGAAENSSLTPAIIYGQLGELLYKAKVTPKKYSANEVKKLYAAAKKHPKVAPVSMAENITVTQGWSKNKLTAYCDYLEKESKQAKQNKILRNNLIFTPEDADLRWAEEVSVEKIGRYTTLHSWPADCGIIFEFTVEKAGNYAVFLHYSKARPLASTGKLVLFFPRALDTKSIKNSQKIVNALPLTGEQWGDKYHNSLKFGTISLPKGKHYLFIADTSQDKNKFVMNLREVQLARTN